MVQKPMASGNLKPETWGRGLSGLVYLCPVGAGSAPGPVCTPHPLPPSAGTGQLYRAHVFSRKPVLPLSPVWSLDTVAGRVCLQLDELLPACPLCAPCLAPDPALLRQHSWQVRWVGQRCSSTMGPRPWACLVSWQDKGLDVVPWLVYLHGGSHLRGKGVLASPLGPKRPGGT